MKNKRFLLIGLFLLITGIVLGALAAHALKAHLTTNQLESFKTGVFYQLLHALLFISFGLYTTSETQKPNIALGLYLALVGVLLFSLSIYFLNLQNLIGISLRWLGPVTPVGGVLMIIGWSAVFLKFFKIN
ncbi:membrane protein [Thermaurantimonas aggregans]|uniref:Membrane protein n=1 Tax=Thermaurantimonas aggregans TaxID=2173829 RepID=A0A401XKT2_9FLAO|nr:DUF423 domain-containing protein [Thermaurantimonas aggregans]MCX8147941.1 DUF423 domain-containing protein [Thermaurantimonas aggregans]GCD77603.1 membrane protein [Thermaurantimonas aggregans]